MKMNENYIKEELRGYPYDIDVRDCVTSTNTILKDEAKNGKKEFSVLIASSQMQGRGRMGRSFFSPDKTGIYMSVILRPNDGINPIRITTDAAVACAIAIEKLSGKNTGIKWVNDIYIDGRKVCGILAESSIGENSFVVLGIGVNAVTPENGFPEDIRMRAGSVFLYNIPLMREKIVVEILKELYKDNDEKTLLDEYRNRSIITGKEIDIIKNKFVKKISVFEKLNVEELKIKKTPKPQQ